MPYVVSTDPCLYLLSDEGICVRITPSKTGGPPQTAIVGAQFVASLDVNAPGGLLGGLEVGAAALFVKQDDKGRFVLLRTATVRAVQERGRKKGEGEKPPRPHLDRPSLEGEETTLTLARGVLPRRPSPQIERPRVPAGEATKPALPPVPKGKPAPPMFQLLAEARPMVPSVMPSHWDEPPTHQMPRNEETRVSGSRPPKKKRP